MMQTRAEAPSDRQAIEAVIRDYFDGWFEGDEGRMARALHVDLAKRGAIGALLEAGVIQDGDPDALDQDTRQTMVEATARGVGRTRAATAADRALDIQIQDIYHWIASVVVRSPIYYEYVHLVRTSDGWKIVNTLWQRTIGEGGDGAG